MCDIDFPRRTVTVAGSVIELAGHLSLEPEAKTEQSLRTLAAPTFLIDELAQHLALHRGSPAADSEALVFVGPKGGVLRRRFVERILRPTAERVRAEAIAAGRTPKRPGWAHVPRSEARRGHRDGGRWRALQRHPAASRSLDGTHDDGALFTSLN